MFALLGILVVIVSVVTGYLASHGNIIALWQPFEVLIICGAALGAFMIANSLTLQIRVFKMIPQIFLGSRHKKEFYKQLLGALYSLFQKSRLEGFLAIENDIELPFESNVFQRFPDVLNDEHLIYFLTDNFRIYTLTGLPSHELEALIDEEIEQISEELEKPAHAVNRVAEALPGFGIVAAVLGIVITMGSIGGSMEEIGTHVAAALVGTFLGIFFAYGFVGPASAHLEALGQHELKAYMCVKAAVISIVSGHPPAVAVETGRKLLPPEMRPSFLELSEDIKQYR
ncbi:flagellar motor stator protein MotA [Marinomonas mediterranea]|jgi:flagellar motor stator protein MotA|uniref:Flagellar motor stator protein MotA n=1 Tax=Marinomonas mediterranea (strain ATCC 700492 / JCM 21426 / NBRC 103028 / MMB-1) TaxID=717774 RepID=F2JWM5_MARM1|nr:flagellar motor stator protein MotA [Marinomonas mediterranea]ADZ91789.1 flagellar motor stator protein MotA [Marinomonas mediterranea MMB-1]WCN09745.1 flagellar motor stator protein MotA [Marinomonas mediterranea]WCN13826.1 flagellar motor stator protein MotA [Marinomonas mediterranea]WCN17882.1 flagellar motor stator protein MotA [Marinomonas mediterranea MMB-1]